jgi:hypothetical protein
VQVTVPAEDWVETGSGPFHRTVDIGPVLPIAIGASVSPG